MKETDQICFQVSYYKVITLLGGNGHDEYPWFWPNRRWVIIVISSVSIMLGHGDLEGIKTKPQTINRIVGQIRLTQLVKMVLILKKLMACLII